MTPEGRIKAKVNRRLAAYPRIWRFMPVQRGLGAPALDYLLCVNGRFVAIETKAKGKTLSPRQEQTRQRLQVAGAWVFVVDDDSSLNTAMAYINDLY